MSDAVRARVLCVDDEPYILEALKRQLDRRFEVQTAASGALALQLLETQAPFVVVVSDMRMPQMNGAQFLSVVRARFPDCIRVLLTGNSESDAASGADSDAQIFRFLSKPCSPALLNTALDAAVEHHRLRNAERELLEKTLRGSLDALGEVLSLACPEAFGRARRIQRSAVQIATAMGLPDVWQVEVSALLSLLGAVTLPEDVHARWGRGDTLRPDEQEMVNRLPALAEGLLERIPRLERVREIIRLHTQSFAPTREDAAPVEARVLRVAVDLDMLHAQGLTTTSALQVLSTRDQYDPAVLAGARLLIEHGATDQDAREVPLRMLQAGMVLAQDLRDEQQNMLLVAKGHLVGASLLARLLNLGSHPGLPELVRVVGP